MSVMPMANAITTWTRDTAVLLAAIAVAGAITVTRQPINPVCVRVNVTGTPTGTVTVSGTVSGASDSETLIWAGAAGPRTTSKEFTAITGISTSLTGGTLIDAIGNGPDGQPRPMLYVVQSGYPVVIQDANFPYNTTLKPGTLQTHSVRLLVDWTDTWTPRVGDIVSDDTMGHTGPGTSAIYRVTAVPAPKRGPLGPSHWQVEADLDRSCLQ